MKWIPITKETLPPIDNGDYPKEYIVRGKGDDPRSGWINIEMRTADQMLYYAQAFEYAQYLDESPDSNQDHEDFILGRLYDWLTDKNRKPSITAFTAGSLRMVAREIEYQVAADDDLVTDAFCQYLTHVIAELQKKELGDIERKNYQKLEIKLRERITKKQ